jgi:hypothetical protein
MKLIAIILFLLFSPPALGDEQVAGVKEGDPAPFDGTCFNIEASVRIIADLENSEAACKIKTDKALEIQAAEYDLKIANLEASLTRCGSLCTERVDIYKNQSIYLQEELKKKKQFHPAWGFVAGVVAGSLITLGSTYAVVHITQN